MSFISLSPTLSSCEFMLLHSWYKVVKVLIRVDDPVPKQDGRKMILWVVSIFGLVGELCFAVLAIGECPSSWEVSDQQLMHALFCAQPLGCIILQRPSRNTPSSPGRSSHICCW